MKIVKDLTKVYKDQNSTEEYNMDITQEMIDELAENYDLNFRQAPILFGHPSSFDEEKPAYGLLTRVWVEGDTLRGELDLNRLGEELVQSGQVINESICFQKGIVDREGNLIGKTGLYIMHHALLGSSNPAVPDLEIVTDKYQYSIPLKFIYKKNVKEDNMEDDDKPYSKKEIDDKLDQMKKDLDDLKESWKKKSQEVEDDTDSEEKRKSKSKKDSDESDEPEEYDKEDDKLSPDEIVDLAKKSYGMGIDSDNIKDMMSQMCSQYGLKPSYKNALSAYSKYLDEKANKFNKTISKDSFEKEHLLVKNQQFGKKTSYRDAFKK